MMCANVGNSLNKAAKILIVVYLKVSIYKNGLNYLIRVFYIYISKRLSRPNLRVNRLPLLNLFLEYFNFELSIFFF